MSSRSNKKYSFKEFISYDKKLNGFIFDIAKISVHKILIYVGFKDLRFAKNPNIEEYLKEYESISKIGISKEYKIEVCEKMIYILNEMNYFDKDKKEALLYVNNLIQKLENIK